MITIYIAYIYSTCKQMISVYIVYITTCKQMITVYIVHILKM